MITSLKFNQVFVFGSNTSGFHGAGSAGLACRGDARNTWRDDPWFQKAMNSPIGSLDRIGKWAVFGEAHGFQIGREGMSYAICTIVRPGSKRSYPLSKIAEHILELFSFASAHPEYEFLYTAVGAGLAGYTNDEMALTLQEAINVQAPPPNITFPENLYNKNWNNL